MRPSRIVDPANMMRPITYSEVLFGRALRNIQAKAYQVAASSAASVVSSVNTFKENGNRFNYFYPKVSETTSDYPSLSSSTH